MFFKCPKCNKVWQYPIEKCPECFLNLERIKSKNIKVIGVSKVTIPTMPHPSVPYFVLLLEDENGNKWVQKSIKEYKIGAAFGEPRSKGRDKFQVESFQNKNSVAIWRAKYDFLEPIEKLIELLGGISINQDSKILILPTLISPTHPHFAQNTRPEILDALLKFLIKQGVNAKNISVASQSFNDFPIEACAKKSRLADIAAGYGVRLINLVEKGFQKENPGFEVTKLLSKNDLTINLPILKIDSKLGVKGALYNLTKLLKKESFESKKNTLGEEKLLTELKNALPKILTIADGTKILKSNGMNTFLGVIMISFNPLNLDRVFAEISMISLPEYLKSTKIEEIKVLGRKIKEIQYKVEEY